jgi:hypothetical protein
MTRIADLEDVGDRVRVLERMGGVGVVEAAAVGAELLDGDLRRNRSARHGLGDRAVDSRGDGAATEVLHQALRDEHEGEHETERQEDTNRATHEIDPEVAERPVPVARPGDAADDRDDHREPDTGGDEVLHGEAQHLAEVAHRHLTRVPLPVGVGDEADGGVERTRRLEARPVGRVERERTLESQQRVETEQRHQ